MRHKYLRVEGREDLVRAPDGSINVSSSKEIQAAKKKAAAKAEEKAWRDSVDRRLKAIEERLRLDADN